MSRYQKGKTSLDFTEARDSEWQWHQVAICKSAHRYRQITTPAPHHSVFYRPGALPAAQRTAPKHVPSNVCRFVACVTQESLCGSCLHTGSDRTSRCVLRTWPAYWRRESACHSLPSVPSTSTCSWSNVRYACSKLIVYVIIRLIMTKYSVVSAGTIFSLGGHKRRVGWWTRSGKLTLTLTSY